MPIVYFILVLIMVLMWLNYTRLYGGLCDGSIGSGGMLAAVAVSSSPLFLANRNAYITDGLK